MPNEEPSPWADLIAQFRNHLLDPSSANALHVVSEVPIAEQEELFSVLLKLQLQVDAEKNPPLRVQDYVARYPEFESQVHSVFAQVPSTIRDEKITGTLTDLAGETLYDPSGEDAGKSGASTPETTATSGLQVGPYRLLRTLGEGGMGQVWLAQQEQPVRRQVALKIIKITMPSQEVLARFEAERQALALMNHENIARIYEAGVTGRGEPYFAMELIRGRPINQYCDANQLPLEPRLHLFLQVCDAVQHAHRKGIIHRDLKPSNILISDSSTQPVAKVIDFGLAKAFEAQARLADRTVKTHYGQILGTLQYMSPEQANQDMPDVDTRTDVYALGTILYELLTGSPPLTQETVRNDSLIKLLWRIQNEEPKRPSRIRTDSHHVHESSSTGRSRRARLYDLDWITLKALEKKPSNRYNSPQDLADDIRRCLRHQPIEAHPPSALYPLKKACQRYKWPILLGLAFLSLLIAGLIGTSSQWLRARQAEKAALGSAREARQFAREMEEAAVRETELRTRAEQETERAVAAKKELATSMEKTQEALYLHQINLAAHALEERNLPLARRFIQEAGQMDRKGFEWHALKGGLDPALQTYHQHEVSTTAVAWSPDGRTVASADDAGYMHIWDRQTGNTLFQGRPNKARICALDFNSDGQLLAVAGFFGYAALWDANTFEEKVRLDGHKVQVFDIAFHPDGHQLATASADNTVKLWNLQDDNEKAGLAATFTEHKQSVYAVDFSSNGRLLVSCSLNGQVLVRSLDDKQPTKRFSVPGTQVFDVEISPDNLLVAACCTPRHLLAKTKAEVGVWNIRSKKLVHRFESHPGTVRTLTFSPDSRFVFTGGDEGNVHVHRLAGHDPPLIHAVHEGPVWGLEVHRDGKMFASCSSDGTAKVAPAFFDSRFQVLGASGGAVALAWLTNQTSIVLSPARGGARILDAVTGDTMQTFSEPGDPHFKDTAVLAIDAHRNRILTKGRQWPGVLNAWDLDAPSNRVFRIHQETEVTAAAFFPDGSRLLTGDASGEVKIYDGVDGQLLDTIGFPNPITAIAIGSAATNTQVLIATGSRTLFTLRLAPETGEWVSERLATNQNPITDMVCSPSAPICACAHRDGTIRLWDIDFRSVRTTLPGHAQGVGDLTFSRDGMLLVSGGQDRVIRLWDMRTGKLFHELRGHRFPVTALALSPDNRQLISVAEGQKQPGRMLVWGMPPPDVDSEFRLDQQHSVRWYTDQLLGALTENNYHAADWYEERLRDQEVPVYDARKIGQAFQGRRKLDSAEFWYQQVLAKDPLDDRTTQQLLLVQSSRVEDAKTEYRQFVQHAEAAPSLHVPRSRLLYNAGNMFKRDGEFADAIRAYRAAIACNKNYPEATCNLGHMYIAQGDYAKGLGALRLGHLMGTTMGQPDVIRRWSYPSQEWIDEAELLLETSKSLAERMEDLGSLTNAKQIWAVCEVCLASNHFEAVEQAARLPPITNDPTEKYAVRANIVLACACLRQARIAAGPEPAISRDNAFQTLQELATLSARERNPGLTDFMAGLLKRQREIILFKKRMNSLEPSEQSRWKKLWRDLQQ